MSNVQTRWELPTGHVLEVVQGDLTEQSVDAIVNAANIHLAHGGGVAGAIVRRGGQQIQTESDEWVAKHGCVPTGDVALTEAGLLPAGFIIHAVGPIWDGGNKNEPQLLRSAVQKSFECAERENFTSIALPAISSGIFGFPKAQAAEIITNTAVNFCRAHPDGSLKLIRFVNIDRETTEYMQAALEQAKHMV